MVDDSHGLADNFSEMRKKALLHTKVQIKDSFSKDLMVINAINNIEEIEKSINSLASRLREWYMVKNPELERTLADNEVFVKVVLTEEDAPSEMGAEITADDEAAIQALALITQGLIETKVFLLLYLEKTMKEYCRNVYVLAGPTIGAKLLREAKSLKRLASLQSSTMQLLGAEKALFRHIKTGAKSPKYGHIVNHPVVINAKKEDKGKAARALADKLSIAARLDYFKGEFLADTFLKDLQKRFNS
jgi:nucleolar protein 56